MGSFRELEEFLEGHYVVERRIGSGAQGTIYEARVKTTGCPVAVKWMIALGDVALERVRRIARFAVPLEHANVAKHHGVILKEDRCALIMELVSGPSLADLLAEKKLKHYELARLIVQAACGLHALHSAGLIHRDVTPGNIVVTSGPDGALVAKIVDLGLLTTADGRVRGVTRAAVGTPYYSAPEQLANDRDAIGAPTDAYALGVISYEALVGRRPFEAETDEALRLLIASGRFTPPRTECPDMPEDVAALITALLKRDPGARPSAADIVARLQPATRAEAWRHARKDRALPRRTFLVSVGSACLGAVGTAALWQPVPARKEQASESSREIRWGYHEFSASDVPALVANAGEGGRPSAFEKAGITLKPVRLERGRDAQIDALRSGAVQVTSMELTYFIEALPELSKSGGRYYILFFSAFSEYELIVRKGVEFLSFRDKDVKHCVTERTPSEMLYRRTLRAHDYQQGTIDSIVQVAAQKVPSTKAAVIRFEGGEVQSAAMWPYDAARMKSLFEQSEGEQGGHALATDKLPIVMVARADLVEREPQLMFDFTRVWMESAAQIREDDTRAIGLLVDRMKWSREDAKGALAGIRLGTFADVRALIGLHGAAESRNFESLFYQAVRYIRSTGRGYESPVASPRALIPIDLLQRLEKLYRDDVIDDPELIDKMVGKPKQMGPPRSFRFEDRIEALDLRGHTLQGIYELLAFLQQHPDATVTLIGSATPSTNKAEDRSVGLGRARKLEQLLVDHRIERWRIQAHSIGSEDSDIPDVAERQRAVSVIVMLRERPPPVVNSTIATPKKPRRGAPWRTASKPAAAQAATGAE